MRSKIKNPLFSKREVTDWISNAVVRALKPASLGAEIPELRLKKLRAYSQGLVAPLLKHIEEGFIRPEEAVVVLLAGAFFIQISQVLESEKLPNGLLVNEIFEGQEVVELPELYFKTPEPRGDEILPLRTKARGKGKKPRKSV